MHEKNITTVKRAAKAKLPTIFGDFDIYGYKNETDGSEHIALVKGDLNCEKTPVVRIHSECLTGDVFHSLKCDCGDQLAASMKLINEHGCGVLAYIKTHEGRGIGLINKIKAYELQEKGQDTAEANITLGFDIDLRSYAVGAKILLDLGIKEIDLITNNPEKISALKKYGIEISKRIALKPQINKHNEKYIRTKSEKMNHLF